MFGKRSDGKRLKGLSAVQKIMPHIMKDRNDSQNLFKYPARVEKLDEFIKKEYENKGITITYMHFVVAAVVRLLALRPQLNRFIMNGRIYKRNSINVSFVVKKALKDTAEETTVKLELNGTENIYEIKDLMDEQINKNSSLKAKNGTDKAANSLTHIPNFLIKIAVWFIKFLDKHGMLPKKLIKVSPFHTSFFVTNLKSIKIDYIYHHLYNFGTTSLFMSMGKEQQEAVVDNGEIKVGKVMNLGIVTDERFCDGFYFAKSLRLLKRMFESPECLLEKLDAKIEDID